MRSSLVLVVVAAAACSKPPPANPEFNDAIRQTFVTFEGEPVELAFALRTLETNIYSQLQVDDGSAQDRAISPEPLLPEDVEQFGNTERDPAAAIPVAVAGASAFPPPDHGLIQLLEDQRPVEPYSPNEYTRELTEGADCWVENECEWLRTYNTLIKENALMTIPYEFTKDFRWIDMGLPDPADVPEGEEPVTTGERWAFVARSYTDQPYSGEQGDSTIQQSYTIEVWIPREETGGTLRLLSVWSETTFEGANFSDAMIASTTQSGIDRNYGAAEDWLEENVGAE